MSRKRIDRQEKGLEIIDINAKGMGVAKTVEGAVYFIKNVVPGDIVDVRVYKKRRGSVSYTHLTLPTKRIV